MYAAKKNIKIKSGVKEYLYYTCGHQSIAKNGHCGRNTILAEWVETEVIEYTRQLVRDPKFAADIQAKIGQKVDSAEIVSEIAGYQAAIKKLERSKANLERDIDQIVDDDRNAQRKREDLNRRLDKIYDEIYDVEDMPGGRSSLFLGFTGLSRLFSGQIQVQKRRVGVSFVYLLPRQEGTEGRQNGGGLLLLLWYVRKRYLHFVLLLVLRGWCCARCFLSIASDNSLTAQR